MDPGHLKYNEPLELPGERHGLIAVMDDELPEGCGHGAEIATGHLSSFQKYSYATLLWQFSCSTDLTLEPYAPFLQRV